MRKHCSAQHGGQAEAITNEEKYREAIQFWNAKCFPDWKHKKPSMWSRATSSQKTSEDSMENDGSQTSSSMGDESRPESLQDDLDSVTLHIDEEGDEEASVSSSWISREMSENGNGISEDDKICQLCGEESRYPGRHIAQKHLSKHLYECPLCDTFGSYESCSVHKHISKMHPEADVSTAPVSYLSTYEKEIRDLQQACFPNRQMKLVRPVLATIRPREKHHCKLCEAEVAQSDRQRHVYHRHFEKSGLFECPLCEFSSNYDVHRVKNHLKWEHKNETDLKPISHEAEFCDKINDLNEKCFPGWQHRRRSADGPSQPPVGHDFTCQLCFKEFKPSSNFLRHVAKDHLQIPLYQCPLCDEHGGQDAYDVRTHMMRVHGVVPGVSKHEPICNVDQNLEEVQRVYRKCFPGRKFKNTLRLENRTTDEPKVTCRECGMEMKTEDRQIHVYRHHLKEQRLYECPLCSFSHHACSSDVKAHIKYAHREQADAQPKSNLIEFSREISDWNERCFPGWINRRLPAAALEDFNRCRICNTEVRQTSRHIAEVHLHISLHQCPLCEYGAAESRLVKRHMRNYHNKKDIKGLEPIANVVERRTEFSELHDRCFPGRPKRLSNITISDDGRRAKCKLCGSTISKKRRLGHLLEMHFHQDIYKCPECDFSAQADEALVQAHIKEFHAEADALEPVSSLNLYIDELKLLSKRCFNDSELKF
ncbi:hypothetical protein L596_024678 [Steinernema carpocapsae]|nr:hypothetical protein L596_024678 [Steinernema carpocapsae]